MPVYPLSDWSIATLRLTAFPVIAERRQDMNWWAEIMDADPEARSQKTSPAQIEIYGPFKEDASRLTLSVTPIRTDWLLTAGPTPSPWPDTLGEFPAVLPEWLSRMRRWLALPEETRFPIQRLALGAVLHHREQSREDGYSRIGRYLSNTLKVNAATDSDLVFQINWFADSAILPGVRINRVNKWGVMAFHLFVLPGHGPSGGRPEGWATTLELDLSTAAEHEGPLPNSRLLELLDELAGHAERIAAEGDGR